MPTQDVARLRPTPKLKVLDGTGGAHHLHRHGPARDELLYSSVKGKNPFKDKRVRQAFNLAVDSEAIKRVIMRGLSMPTAIMVAPGVHGVRAELDKRLPYDLDGAKKLLAEAGYPNGFEFGLDCPNNRYVNDEEICQALVGMWAQVGLKVKLKRRANGHLHPEDPERRTRAYMLGWGVDPSTRLRPVRAGAAAPRRDRRRRQLQPRPRQRPEARRARRRRSRPSWTKQARRAARRGVRDSRATTSATCRCTTSRGPGR